MNAPRVAQGLVGAALVACAAASVSACSKATGGGSPPASSQVPSTPAPAAAAGPEILTTTSDPGAKTPTDVRARFARFQVASVDGTDTLLVDGKPATFTIEGADAPQPIQANATLTLVGVFELQDESVAWVVIGGGTACAGTHVLIPVGQTRDVRGLAIKGCDDRGTMRKAGDRIVFDAGGTSGAYDHGRIVGS